jgi:hypothetical protein
MKTGLRRRRIPLPSCARRWGTRSFSVGSWFRLHVACGAVGRCPCAEMWPMGHKRCRVSESFGSSSIASLKTQPTYVHPRASVRARPGDNDFTDSARPPIRPPTHPFNRLQPRLPPKRSIAHDFALVASCHGIVSQEPVLRCWHKRHCAVRFSLRVSF